MKALEKQQAILLRGQGLSYREIQQSIAVSRSSLNRWLQGIQLTDEQQARLQCKNALIQKKFIEYNAQKRTDSQARKAAVIQACAQEIGRLSGRELQLIGAALYWGEGSKAATASVVEFVNSDPTMIAVMMRWFRLCCHVPEHKLRARIQLHDATQRDRVEQFWSHLTGIPTSQFTYPIFKVASSSQGKRGNCLPYGTLHVRIADVNLLAQIRGWIHGLGLAPSSSPV